MHRRAGGRVEKRSGAPITIVRSSEIESNGDIARCLIPFPATTRLPPQPRDVIDARRAAAIAGAAS
jgi:hypothetical protein